MERGGELLRDEYLSPGVSELKTIILSEVARKYAKQRQISKSCHSNYRKHVCDFERWAQRELGSREANATSVNAWLVSKIRAGNSPYYVVALRSSILAVHSLARELHTRLKPLRLAPIRRPDLLVRVWSPEDVRLIADCAAELPGPLGPFPRGPYLSTLILAAWNTGLRRGDLHRIRIDQIDRDGYFVAIAHKTGRRKPCYLPPSLIARVTWDRDGVLWPKPGSDEIVRRAFKEAIKIAATRSRGLYRGVWRDIRRSAEDSAERLCPGRGHLYAGHERRTYERYYRATVDRPEALPVEI